MTMSISKLKDEYIHIICAVLAFVSAITSITPLHARHLSHFHVTGSLTLHASGITLGFLTLYFSLQLLRRKQLAFRLTLVVIGVLLLLNLFHGYNPWKSLVYTASLLILAMSSKSFNVKSGNLSVQHALSASLAVMVSSVAYGAAGFYLIEKRAFGIDFSVFESVRYAILQLFLFDNSIVEPLTRQAHIFILSLDFISITTLIIVISNLFKPVRFALFPSIDDQKTAEILIQTHSTSVEDFFKLWPRDKHYFFNGAKTAVIAYKVESGTALILDSPSGNRRAFKRLLKDFIAFSEQNGWIPAIIHADTHVKDLASELGLGSLFIGNEAMINVPSFLESTVHSKHFRYVENKAKREKLKVEIWSPPHTVGNLAQLKQVSDNWLSIPGRREYTFVMGYFDIDYINKSEVAVLKNDDAIIAYVNVIPSYLKTERSIDHMRHTKDMSGVGMHYLLKRLIEHFGDNKVIRFNLGLSPLSGIEELSDPSVTERLLQTIKTLGTRYYSFAGLEQFKDKFKPDWQPRYILYRGSPANLVRISNSLNRAITIPTKRDTRTRNLNIMSVLAGISFLSFLLAYPLGLAQSGLASELGSKGSQYNWLFNTADILCGLIIIYLSYFGLRAARQKRQRWQYGFFAVGGAGNIIAALMPLNATIGIGRIAISSEPVHALFSVISILGLCSAALLYTLSAQKLRKPMQTLFLITVLFTILSMLLLNSPYDGLVQKIQLALLAVFISLIGLSHNYR